MVRSHADRADALEHVSVHRPDPGEVTVGVFSLLPTLAAAEDSAAVLLDRAVARSPELAGFTVLSVGAALVPGPWWTA
ncbi:hypothetical protein ACIQBJ_08960 [Kitasatospora sp. NPDC088391]|uniref:hypothetical protein n=1 Tax=Kitasatospora sp. NPDC088391 TaxID=3364074 RepID=UPI003802FE1A